MKIQQIDFFERIQEIARSHTDSNALICGERQVKYRELPEMILRLVNGMRSSGLKPGLRVALLMDNSIEYLLLIAAGFRLGSISVCINTRIGVDEMKKWNEYNRVEGVSRPWNVYDTTA